MYIWEAFYRSDPSGRNRDLFRGALGPGIPAPEGVIPREEPVNGLGLGWWPYPDTDRCPGWHTPTRRLNWFAARDGDVWLWAERPEPGQESMGYPGRVVCAAYVRWGSTAATAYTADGEVYARHLDLLVRAMEPLGVTEVETEDDRMPLTAWAAAVAPDWTAPVEEAACA